MKDPAKLIDHILNRELSQRADELVRSQIQQRNTPHAEGMSETVSDYEEDLANIKASIELWHSVRPKP